MGKCKGCGKVKEKSKKLECLVSQAACKVKHGVQRIGKTTGEQGSKHNLAVGLILIALVSGSLLIGAAWLASSPMYINNPTAGSAAGTSTITILNGDGSKVGPWTSGQTLSGTITVSVTYQTAMVVETASVTGYTQRQPTPYYWCGMSLTISPVAGGTPNTIWAQPSADHVAAASSWAASFKYNANPLLTTYNNLPYTSDTMSMSFNTATLPSGSYTLQILVAWHYAAYSPQISSKPSGSPYEFFPPSLYANQAGDGNQIILSELFGGANATKGVGPTKITDLAATKIVNGSTTLTWTTPIDSTGTLSGYVLKYSTVGPINTGNFADLFTPTWNQSWTPGAQGGQEMHTLQGLNSSNTYWFAIVTFDNNHIYSDISNCASTNPSNPLVTALPIVFIVLLVAIVASALYLRKRKQ